MEKDKIIEQMLIEKGNKNNSIDLDAYARGLIDMYDKLVLPQTDVRQQREQLIGLLTKLEDGGGSSFIDKEKIVDDYLKGN